MLPGKIVWLNGTSCSGKSSIANAIKELSDEEVVCYDADSYFPMMPARDIPAHFLNNTQYALNQEVMEKSLEGKMVVVDTIFLDHLRALETMKSFKDSQLYFVCVYCPLNVLEMREKERGDRVEGQARGQFNTTYVDWTYDLRFDTSQETSVDIGDNIRKHVSTKEPVGAFADNLKRVREICS